MSERGDASVIDRKILDAASKLGDPYKVLNDHLKSYLIKRIVELTQIIRRFEKKYGVNFKEFEGRNLLDQLGHTWEVEEDYYEWDRAVTELERLEEILMELV